MVRLTLRENLVRTSFRLAIALVFMASLALLSACGGGGGGGGGTDGPTGSPSEGHVAGSWTGSITSPVTGDGFIAFDIAEGTPVRNTLDLFDAARGYYNPDPDPDPPEPGVPIPISGYWTVDFDGDTYDDAGSFTGIFLDGVITGSFAAFYGPCSYEFTATVSGSMMTGSFTSNCKGVLGTFSGTYVSSLFVPVVYGEHEGVITSNNRGQGLVGFFYNQSGVNFSGNGYLDFTGEGADIFGFISGSIDGTTMYYKLFPYKIEYVGEFQTPVYTVDLSECPLNFMGEIDLETNTIMGSWEAYHLEGDEYDCENNPELFGDWDVTL